MTKTTLTRYRVKDWFNSNTDENQHAFIYLEHQNHLLQTHLEQCDDVDRDLAGNLMITIEDEPPLHMNPHYHLHIERSEYTRLQSETGLRELEKILIEWAQADFGWDEFPEIIDGGYLRLECSDEYLKSKGYEKGRFGFDDGPLFDGWHWPESRWNGWANPFFTAETRKEILATFNTREAQDSIPEEDFDNPECNPWIEVANDNKHNQHGLYCMGWGLNWSEEKDWD